MTATFEEFLSLPTSAQIAQGGSDRQTTEPADVYSAVTYWDYNSRREIFKVADAGRYVAPTTAKYLEEIEEIIDEFAGLNISEIEVLKVDDLTEHFKNKDALTAKYQLAVAKMNVAQRKACVEQGITWFIPYANKTHHYRMATIEVSEDRVETPGFGSPNVEVSKLRLPKILPEEN